MEQRDALTYICITVIVLALLAMFLAFLYEVVVGLKPESRSWFLTWLVYTGKIPPSHDEDEKDKIQLQSALGANGMGDEDDDSPALTQAEWEQFKSDYAEAQASLQRAEDRLESEKAAMSKAAASSAAAGVPGTNPLALRRGASAFSKRSGAKAKFKQRQMQAAKRGKGLGGGLMARRPRGSVMEASSSPTKERSTSAVLKAVVAGAGEDGDGDQKLVQRQAGASMGVNLRKLREEAARAEAEEASKGGGDEEEA